MVETWEETKARLKKQGINLQSDVVVIDTPKPPRPRYDSEENEVSNERLLKRFNIHKRSLPIGNPPLDKIVVFRVTKAEAEWWINHVLLTKAYHDEVENTKTLIYYDAIPIDAQPHERSIYYNPKNFTSETGERYFEFQPKRPTDAEVEWK